MGYLGVSKNIMGINSGDVLRIYWEVTDFKWFQERNIRLFFFLVVRWVGEKNQQPTSTSGLYHHESGCTQEINNGYGFVWKGVYLELTYVIGNIMISQWFETLTQWDLIMGKILLHEWRECRTWRQFRDEWKQNPMIGDIVGKNQEEFAFMQITIWT